MISIVICSVDPNRFNAVSDQYRRAFGSSPFEIVGVHDAQSLCEGYTRGLAASKGDIVIFSHDDIEIWSDNFPQRLRSHLAQYDVVGVAGASKIVAPGWISAGPPYIHGHITHGMPDGTYNIELFGTSRRLVDNVKAMDGVFLAFRRPVIERIGWDAQTFNGFHMYDLDATFRAHLAGFRLAVALDITLLHMSGGTNDTVWRHFADLFARKHAPFFDPTTPRRYQWSSLRVACREDAFQVISDMQRQLQ